jgi:phosphatidate cytidylyltransferase
MSALNSKTALRLFSAAIGIIVLFGTMIYAGVWGLRALTLVVVVLGTRELLRILFKSNDRLAVKLLFTVLMMLIFCLTLWSLEAAAVAFCMIVVCFFSVSLWLNDRFQDLNSLSSYQTKSLMGFFYLGLLPAMAGRLLDLNHGPLWFITLLAFVFAGDSCAYFFGMMMGKNLLMPAISPKKTIEGALGGLLGSMIAAGVIVALQADFPPGRDSSGHLPLWPVVGLSLFAGAVGQMGDLFESLLKRVANQKDSGSFMPGHGGVLDRIDGVLFAAPIVLAGATIIENYFIQK